MLNERDEEKEREEALEETYERLFPKIGRDFVTQEDLDELVQRLTLHLEKFLLGIDLSPKTAKAVKKAEEYKKNIEKGKKLRGRYKDLVKIDASEEE